MSKQLLRCGTSIGAKLAEVECAISRKDFLAKVYIALKECAETKVLAGTSERNRVSDQQSISKYV